MNKEILKIFPSYFASFVFSLLLPLLSSLLLLACEPPEDSGSRQARNFPALEGNLHYGSGTNSADSITLSPGETATPVLSGLRVGENELPVGPADGSQYRFSLAGTDIAGAVGAARISIDPASGVITVGSHVGASTYRLVITFSVNKENYQGSLRHQLVLRVKGDFSYMHSISYGDTFSYAGISADGIESLYHGLKSYLLIRTSSFSYGYYRLYSYSIAVRGSDGWPYNETGSRGITINPARGMIVIGNAVPIGIYGIEVTARGGPGGVKRTTLSIKIVSPGSFDYGINSLSIVQGQAAAIQNNTLSGVAGKIYKFRISKTAGARGVSADPLPGSRDKGYMNLPNVGETVDGVANARTPNRGIAIDPTTGLLVVGSSVPAGRYAITVKAISEIGGGTLTAMDLMLEVTEAPWRNISGAAYTGWKTTGNPEEPYNNDYANSGFLKLFLAKPRSNGNPHIWVTLDQAEEKIRQLDRITQGMPKVIYLVGWQYRGHDSGYPALGQVNPGLTSANTAEAARARLRELIRTAARDYHSKISLHINMIDAYDYQRYGRELWQVYKDKNLLQKNYDGSLRSKPGDFDNTTMNFVDTAGEWDKGYAVKRIDGLLRLLPELRDSGTIHMDANWARPSPGTGHTAQDQITAMRKIFRYWKQQGLDPTTEGFHWPGDVGGIDPGNAYVGLLAGVWWYEITQTDFLEKPARLLTGGTINTGADKAFLFGDYMHAEDFWSNDYNENNGNAPLSTWGPKAAREFSFKNMQSQFLNRFNRLRVEGSGNGRVAKFSDGLETRLNDKSVRWVGAGRGSGTVLLRKNTDTFFPALWKAPDRVIIAYSEHGYTNKTWRLPGKAIPATAANGYEAIPATDWSILSHVRITPVAVSSATADTAVRTAPVWRGLITLSLAAGELVTIEPVRLYRPWNAE